VVDSLKALDPNRPIREADIGTLPGSFCSVGPAGSASADLGRKDLTEGCQSSVQLAMA